MSTSTRAIDAELARRDGAFMTLDRRTAIEADRSLTPDQRLLLSISVTYETFFAEAGCPLNKKQQAALDSLRDGLAAS